MVQTIKYSFDFILSSSPSGWLETVSKKLIMSGKLEILLSSVCYQIARLLIVLKGKAGEISFPAVCSPSVVHVFQFEISWEGRIGVRAKSWFLSSRTIPTGELWSKKAIHKAPEMACDCTGSKCSSLKCFCLCLWGPTQEDAVAASLEKVSLLQHWFQIKGQWVGYFQKVHEKQWRKIFQLDSTLGGLHFLWKSSWVLHKNKNIEKSQFLRDFL